MTDPLSSVPPPTDASGAAGEGARIEHLLVTGLDHYFAGEFETAINLWTRVLFLDRNHDRARAYIERARSAQSERQRENEALVHEGLDAFDRGDVEQARTLLSNALERGASHDLALGVLGRIDRLDVGTSRQTVPGRRGFRRRRSMAGAAAAVSAVERPTPGRFWVINLLAIALLATASWWVWSTSSWQSLWPSPVAANPTAMIPETTGPLPVPSVSEFYLRRGRALFESGRLRDALAMFDRVPAGDPLRAAADDMRARIQRALLALALAETATGAVPASPAGGQRPE